MRRRSRRLDAIGGDDQPMHVLSFGTQVDAKGVLGGPTGPIT
ncbi:MAG TPA: hypothetical protein VFV66_20890 [Nonomuraea sp.]|nr:hypothetical protein [Nonomuraea sp.]